MPIRIPTAYESGRGQQLTDPARIPYQQDHSSVEAFGGTGARALGQLAQGFESGGRVLDQMAEKRREDRVRNDTVLLYSDYMQKAGGLRNEMLLLKGADAEDAEERFRNGLLEIRRELEKDQRYSQPEVRRRFDTRVAEQEVSWGLQVQQHSMAQHEVVNQATSELGIDTTIQGILGGMVDEDQGFEDIRQFILRDREDESWGAEDQMVYDKIRRGYHVERFNQLVVKSPAEAESYLQKHANEFDQTVMDSLQGDLQGYKQDQQVQSEAARIIGSYGSEQAAVAAAEGLEDYRIRERVATRVRRHFADARGNESEYVGNLMKEARLYAFDNGGSLDGFDAAKRRILEGEGYWKSIQNYVDAGGIDLNKDPNYIAVRANNFQVMREEFLMFPESSLEIMTTVGIANSFLNGEITESQMNELLDVRTRTMAEISKGTPDPKLAQLRTTNQIVEQAFQSVIPTGSNDSAQKQDTKRASFYRAVEDELTIWRGQNPGREPTATEIDDIAKRVAQLKVKDPGWFRDGEISIFDIEDIPLEHIPQIQRIIEASGLQNTDDNMKSVGAFIENEVVPYLQPGESIGTIQPEVLIGAYNDYLMETR